MSRFKLQVSIRFQTGTNPESFGTAFTQLHIDGMHTLNIYSDSMSALTHRRMRLTSAFAGTSR